MNYESTATDVLIIGAGAAGLRTAIELADADIDVLLVSNRDHGDAHTVQAAGGINASLSTRDKDDDWTLHAADTIREGRYVCQPRAVELLARNAPRRVRELARWGCPFARTDDGSIDQRYFGAQSYRRTCFVGDRTGKAMLETLIAEAEHRDIAYRSGVTITEILVDDEQAVGAVGVEAGSGDAMAISARAVVIAAGGCSGLYERNTSRSGENIGAATGLAWRAGAVLRDMEFVQFHPTGMAWPDAMRGQLVSEAVRGEGGRLYNAEGHRFMEDYAPDEMELAPRDVVARAIHTELDAGRGTDRGGVVLDISHREPEFIKERLPAIYERYDQLGVDITDEPMPVAPSAHYAMGGISVDHDTGQTDVDGLFAVGEATAGLHGANRLGGNSLAETVVFGQLTGAFIAEVLPTFETPDLKPATVEPALDKWTSMARQHGRYRPQDLVAEVRDILQRRAGIVRRKRDLETGLQQLDAIRRKSGQLKVYTDPGSSLFETVCHLGFMLDTAELMLESAITRRESRGAHFRSDCGEGGDSWQVSIICRRGFDNGSYHIETEPIEAPSDDVQEGLDRDVHLDYHHLE